MQPVPLLPRSQVVSTTRVSPVMSAFDDVRSSDFKPVMSHDVDNGMEVTGPSPTKRMRYSDSLCASLSTVSLTTTRDSSMDDSLMKDLGSTLSQATSPSPNVSPPGGSHAQEKPLVEWWKHPKPQSNRPREASSASSTAHEATQCFVCQRDFSTEPDHIARQSPRTVMPHNALLAYLSPRQPPQEHTFSFSMPDVPQHDELTPQESDVCSFCERPACSRCVALCEVCESVYCSFCTTTDYNGTISRTVCLDCHRDETSKARQQHDDDDDAMHIE